MTPRAGLNGCLILLGGGGGSCDQRLHFPVVVIVSKKCFHRTVTVTILTDYFVTPLSFIRL